MTHWTLARGNRHKYTALEYELFWDYNDENLYIWHNDQWVLIGGDGKNFLTEAGSNLEIVYKEDDTEHRHPILRLKDDIDVDTMTLGKFYEKKTVADEQGVQIDVYFVIEDKQNIYFKSHNGTVKFNYTGIPNTGNVNPTDTGNQWYEVSMDDFRKLTNLPDYTGSTLDQYQEDCWLYFDIYVKEEASHFSIDRVFITHGRATTDDEIVSDGRIWCHNPYWMEVNDKHKVDVSDGFYFLPNIFHDDSDNDPYVPGQEVEILHVYKTIPGGVLTQETIKNPYPRWKGTVNLGEVEDCTFFPLVHYKPGSDAIIGGKTYIETTRSSCIERAVYHISVCSSGKCSIYGSDDHNVKDTVNLVELKDGSTVIGLRTHSILEKTYTYEEIKGDEYGVSTDVYFQLNSHLDVRLVSDHGEAIFTRRTDFLSQGNTNGGNTDYDCWWFEMSMRDFKRVLGLPARTGSKLDLFGDSCYVYFDIYFNSPDTAFSIDRAFITTHKAYSDDDVVSEGRIWCHNPNWMVPNDKHTVDVSDGFTFISNIFDDSANNLTYTHGQKVRIMYVYLVVPGQTTTITHVTESYKPPKKVKVMFNGWDSRKKLKADLNITEEDIVSSVILARN